jgi:hypothetical protein
MGRQLRRAKIAALMADDPSLHDDPALDAEEPAAAECGTASPERGVGRASLSSVPSNQASLHHCPPRLFDETLTVALITDASHQDFEFVVAAGQAWRDPSALIAEGTPRFNAGKRLTSLANWPVPAPAQASFFCATTLQAGAEPAAAYEKAFRNGRPRSSVSKKRLLCIKLRLRVKHLMAGTDKGGGEAAVPRATFRLRIATSRELQSSIQKAGPGFQPRIEHRWLTRQSCASPPWPPSRPA